jgi:histidinol dehydrogenase
MKKIENPPKESWPEILKRPTQTFVDIECIVKEVFDKIRREGDAALSQNHQSF